LSLTNLDIDALRTLIVASDLGGYGRAAERLGRTPSAVSLQMKRLQDQVGGAALFGKVGRRLVLTEVGEIVLRYARRMLELNDEVLDTIRGACLDGNIRLGFSQEFVEHVVPQVLSRFAKLYPRIQIEIRIDGNAALVDAVENDQLDLALAIGHAERPTAQGLGELKLVWIAGREFARRPDQLLPLVVLGPKCMFRLRMLQALDQLNIGWRIAAVSPSLSGLWASAIGGLGITVRSEMSVPSELVSASDMFGLPNLGSFAVTLHKRAQNASTGLERLADIVADVVAQNLPSTSSRGDSV
jgi:DNA-binding transcriptional LysR family regulator